MITGEVNKVGQVNSKGNGAREGKDEIRERDVRRVVTWGRGSWIYNFQKFPLQIFFF